MAPIDDGTLFLAPINDGTKRKDISYPDKIQKKMKKILFRITHAIFLLSWQVLNTITVENPLIPVHSNIDGKYYKDAEQVKKQLPRQICKPVKWEQTMHILYERNRGTAFPLTFECGPGKSLKAILKMCNAKAFDSCSAIEA